MTTTVFEELDLTTRLIMISEFEDERGATCSSVCESLSPLGAAAFPILMRAVMTTGNESSLAGALSIPQYWRPKDSCRHDVGRDVPRNFRESAVRCALSEFTYWYVRGLAKRHISEAVTRCEVYSASSMPCEAGACALHDGEVFKPAEVYYGCRLRLQGVHRVNAVTIPAGDGCYHSIRRKRAGA